MALADALGFDVDTPWEDLPAKVRKAVLHGHDTQVHVRYSNRYGRERSYYTGFEGVLPYIERRHAEAESDTSRERYEGFMREVPCPTCGGARLKPMSSRSRSAATTSPRSARCRSTTRRVSCATSS